MRAFKNRKEQTMNESTVQAFTVTADTVTPVTNAINSALNTLIPIGIGIMGTFIAISLIKRVIYTFL